MKPTKQEIETAIDALEKADRDYWVENIKKQKKEEKAGVTGGRNE